MNQTKEKWWTVSYTRVSQEQASILAPSEEEARRIIQDTPPDPDEVGASILNDWVRIDDTFQHCEKVYHDSEDFAAQCALPIGHFGPCSAESLDEVCVRLEKKNSKDRTRQILREMQMLCEPQRRALDEPELQEDADYVEVKDYLETLKPWLLQEKGCWKRLQDLLEELQKLIV